MKTENRKKKVRESATEAPTFSPYYVWQELKKVRWAKWKTVGSKAGTARNFGDVLGFMIITTLLSVLFSAGISFVASYM